jgi:hypothetical protein
VSVRVRGYADPVERESDGTGDARRSVGWVEAGRPGPAALRRCGAIGSGQGQPSTDRGVSGRVREATFGAAVGLIGAELGFRLGWRGKAALGFGLDSALGPAVAALSVGAEGAERQRRGSALECRWEVALSQRSEVVRGCRCESAVGEFERALERHWEGTDGRWIEAALRWRTDARGAWRSQSTSGCQDRILRRRGRQLGSWGPVLGWARTPGRGAGPRTEPVGRASWT